MAFCNFLMSAALAAAEKGLRVILLEARPWQGGFFDYRAAAGHNGKPLFERARELAKSVENTPGIRLLTHSHECADLDTGRGRGRH